MTSLIEVKNLSKRYPVEGHFFRASGFVDAVKNVSFTVGNGETVALVGASGSGKSTLARIIQGLVEPSSGAVWMNGKKAGSLSRLERARTVQMVFQDPFSSLNPKLSVGNMLREAVMQSAAPGVPKDRICDLLESVGLSPDILDHYPHQFSGGQRQRLGIARALAVRPQVLIADEPVSALDLSVQAQILNLLAEIKEKFNIACLLIAHDLTVVERMAERVIVLKDGEIEEEGNVKEIFGQPRTATTRMLLAAADLT
jgi:ABC-type glutathione transport system ATPase component